LEYRLDYGPKHPIAAATATFSLGEGDYLKSIAPARTFVTQEEAQQLQSRGLARHVSYRDLLVFGDAGPIDNTLRFADECARHKLLDLIGDLALCGHSIVGRIVAFRSGHVLNGRMAECLWRLAQRNTAETQVA
jgi:UDP-3-O-acyl-N-acetylglucosamine deacetylase